MSEPPKFNFDRATVLIVDADQLCLQVANNILCGFGFRKIFRCATTAAATDVIKTRALDIVIIDPTGFGDDGYKLVSWMRSNKSSPSSNCAVLMTCGHTTVSLISRTQSIGADYVICKPFSTSALLDRLLWVAKQEGRRGLVAPAAEVSASGSGLDLW